MPTNDRAELKLLPLVLAGAAIPPAAERPIRDEPTLHERPARVASTVVAAETLLTRFTRVSQETTDDE